MNAKSPKTSTIRSPRAGKRRAALKSLRQIADSIAWVKSQLDVSARIYDGTTRHIDDNSICERSQNCDRAEFAGHTWNGRVRQLHEYPENDPAKLDEMARYLQGIATLCDGLAMNLVLQSRELRKL